MGTRPSSIDELDENTLIVDYWLDFLSARETAGKPLLSQFPAPSSNRGEPGQETPAADFPERPAKFGTG